MRLFLNIILLLLIFTLVYYSYKYLAGNFQLAGIYASGLLTGILSCQYKFVSFKNELSSYKRELEKKSVISSEADDRVKVLESKINVLEKALEKAINK